MLLLKPVHGSLLLPSNAVVAAIEDIYRWSPLETGGILMGSWGDPVEVSWMVGGGPEADRSPTSFDPDQSWQEDQVARIYDESGRRVDYLGDWHSHPGGKPYLSPRDKRVARLIGSAGPARCQSPVMWVIGADSSRIEWQAFRLRGRWFERMAIKVESASSAGVRF